MRRIYNTTQKSYDKHVDQYVQNTFHVIPPPLPDFIKSLAPSALVVDLGCGPGRESRSFIAAGMRYLGIDNSSKTILKAQELNPEAQFMTQSFLEISFESESIDAFWAVSSLYHLTKLDFIIVLERLYGFLRRQGQMFIVMKEGSDEHFMADTRYPDDDKKFVTYYSMSELRNMYVKTGFFINQMYKVTKDDVNKVLNNNYENRNLLVAWLIKK